MNTAELIKKLNKSLIYECVMVIGPSILYLIWFMLTIVFAFVGAFLGMSENVIQIIALLLLVIVIMICLVFFIIKIITTIIAMNSCINYFKEKNDIVFTEKVSKTKTSYIIAIILSFIPLINLISMGIFIYNLIMWFNIKDRLNTNVQPQDNQASNNTENNNIGLDQNS